jgi:teichoic acid transport system permease protein
MTAPTAPGEPSVRAYSDIEQVFEPHSSELPPLRSYLKEVWERRAFVVEMAKAQLRGKRSSTIAGQLWAVLDPLFQAAVYFFLITVLRAGGARDTGPALAALIFCVFMFNLTAMALNDGGRSIVQSKSLMLNTTFPRMLLPLASIYKGLLGLVPSLGIYLIIHLVLGQPIGPGIAMLPLLLAIQTVTNAGLAMLVATLTVFVRDMTNALTYISRVLLFTTPVIYSPEVLSPGLQRVLSFNPYFALFNCYRAVVAGEMPPAGWVFQAMGFSVLFIVLGVRVFLSHERAFAMRL